MTLLSTQVNKLFDVCQYYNPVSIILQSEILLTASMLVNSNSGEQNSFRSGFKYQVIDRNCTAGRIIHEVSSTL